MLGADLGTTLAVQALSLDLSALMPLLLLAGVILAAWPATGRRTDRPHPDRPRPDPPRTRPIGAASEPMRASEVTTLVLARLAHDPVLALSFAALFTWAMHSSVAFVLFVISLTGAGVVDLPLALTLVLGANVGSGLVALGLGFDQPVAARRVLDGNLGFRAIGALAVFPIGPITAGSPRLGDDPARLAAHFHTLFNLGLAVVFLPLTARPPASSSGPSPTRTPGREVARLDHLDPALLDRPALALNAATRAMLGLADKVELMLRETILTFDEPTAGGSGGGGARGRGRCPSGGDQVLPRPPDAGRTHRRESAQVLETVLFTTNLEHIGDIIDKGLLRLAAKKQKQDLHFSADGWADIRAFHALIADQMRRALAVFVSRDANSPATLSPRRTGCATRRCAPPNATSAASATACRRRSRPAPSTSTSCATSSASTPISPPSPIRSWKRSANCAAPACARPRHRRDSRRRRGLTLRGLPAPDSATRA